MNSVVERLKLAVDWAFAHGLIIRSADHPNECVHAPFSLYPSPFPKHCYEKAVQLAPLFNALVDRLANDESFIDHVMQELSQSDDFMLKLYEIFKQVRGKNYNQGIHFGIHRSDYLLHRDSESGPLDIRQVELNTIASSFSSLSNRVSDLHQFLEKRLADDDERKELPTNTSFVSIADGIAQAHNLFGVSNAVVVMIVQPDERNAFDQRWIEFNLFERHGIHLIRKTLAEMEQQSVLDSQGNLMIGEKVVSVIYFRAGYTPNDYPSDKEWSARLKMEHSSAIKCPNLHYHLVGTKKVQQILADPSILQKYVDDPEQMRFVRSCFSGLYPLDESESGLAAYQMAMENLENFVMKPQREGGGNNIYGKDIPPFLEKLSSKQRNAYILMDLIRTPPHENVLVKSGTMITASVVSELGIYGIWLSRANQVYINQAAGYLLRTKSVGTNEGGVATGYSVLDSLSLI